MTQSLRALMEKAIDYAGLFPPATLPMEKAVADYKEYLECPDSRMLSRFICPTTRLREFEKTYAGLTNKGGPYLISALGRKAEDPERFTEYVQEDVEAIKQFVERNAGKTVVDAFEFCLPPGLASQPEKLQQSLDSATKTIIQHTASSSLATVYYETALSMSWQEDIEHVVRAIAEQTITEQTITEQDRSSITQSVPDKTAIVGFKFRCGGVKAEQFPSVEQVVCCIKSCINEGVRLKLTAGLHHPFRHFNESVQTKMHGFINIFTATLLGKMYKLDETVLTEIIEDEDHTNFRFKEQSLSWKDLSITADQITEGRNNTIISFGCCNFDEPREDLQKSGLF